MGVELERGDPPRQGLPVSGHPYECCTVVGSGGILRNSSCGPEIDRAPVVIR
ncbi:unnamed protein product, partial [Lepidochelys kempii]